MNNDAVILGLYDPLIQEQINNLTNELNKIEDYIGMNTLGLQVDFPNRTFTRLAGAVGKSQGTDFDVFPMYGGRRRCNLTDGGVVLAYYGSPEYSETGYTTVEIVKDGVTYPIGTQVQVMVEQPKFYYKVEPLVLDTNTVGYHLRKANYYISSIPVKGFKIHPAFVDRNNGNVLDKIYISAYEGCLYDTSAESYVTNDAQVMNTSEDKLSSIAGVKPCSGLSQNLTRPNVELLAQNRGSHWHGQDIYVASMEQMLMIIELGMFNTQSAITNGVVSITDNSSYNCSSLTGSTYSLGNTTGKAASTINDINGTQTTYTDNGKTSVNYRGKENFWGNMWKFVYGVNIHGNGSQGGGIPYICTDYAYAESKNSGNYESAGFSCANANGYVNAFGYGDEKYDWVFILSDVANGASSSVPVGDYYYVAANLNGYKVALLGGAWAYSSHAGAFDWALNAGVGNRNRTIGASLWYA